MAIRRPNLCRDTSATSGTGDIVLANNPATGFKTLDDVCSTGDYVWAFVRHQSLDEYQFCKLTRTATAHTYSRSDTIDGTNGASNVNFSAGGLDVIVSAPHEFAALLDVAYDGAAHGDILYRGASSWARLAAGTSGHVLKTQGASADPQWAAESAGGSSTEYVLLNYGAFLTPGTAGAAQGSAETTTNGIPYGYWAFDASTEEQVYVIFPTPANWDASTFTVTVYWTHPATTTNFGVVWELSALALDDSDALDQAMGAEVDLTDTGGTTDDVFETAASSAITAAGTPAAGDMIVLRVARDVANASDTMAVDARLLGVRIALGTV